MPRKYRYLRHQVPGLMQIAAAGLGRALGRPGKRSVRAEIAPPSRRLLRDYLRSLDCQPDIANTEVPAHFFPQWAVPLTARTFSDAPVSMRQLVNAGCRLQINSAIPAGVSIEITSHLEDIDVTDSRVLLRSHVTSGPPSAPNAIVADLFLFARTQPSGKSQKKTEEIPKDAIAIDKWTLRPNAGIEFALYTGDPNPIHFSKRYARTMGYRNPILHGFSTFARAFESIVKNVHKGDRSKLTEFEARFRKPLPLPSQPVVFISGSNVYVADDSQKTIFMSGSFRSKDD